MDKSTRNAIERATQQARKLLDDDFSSQLEGTFDVLRSGAIAQSGGVHLSARQQFQRGKIVAAIDHKRASGMTPLEAVADYVRDAAFTTLNRFIALKMLEARELVQECITKGEQSAGYREFCGMAPGLALIPDAAGYRFYIESLFDEFSTEIKVLFDRRDAASILWPLSNRYCVAELTSSTDLFAASLIASCLVLYGLRPITTAAMLAVRYFPRSSAHSALPWITGMILPIIILPFDLCDLSRCECFP